MSYFFKKWILEVCAWLIFFKIPFLEEIWTIVQKFWSITPTPTANLEQSCPLQQKPCPFPPSSTETNPTDHLINPAETFLTSPTYSWRKFDQSRPLWHTLLANPVLSHIYFDQSQMILQNVWAIPPIPTDTNTTWSHRKFDQYHPLLQHSWPIPPDPRESLTNPTIPTGTPDQILPSHGETLTNPSRSLKLLPIPQKVWKKAQSCPSASYACTCSQYVLLNFVGHISKKY